MPKFSKGAIRFDSLVLLTGESLWQFATPNPGSSPEGDALKKYYLKFLEILRRPDMKKEPIKNTLTMIFTIIALISIYIGSVAFTFSE